MKKHTFEARPVDPVTGARRRLRAGSQAELDYLLEKFRTSRRDLAHGANPEDVSRGLRHITGGGQPLRVYWETWIKTVGQASRGARLSTWATRLEPWFGGRRLAELDEQLLRYWQEALRSKRVNAGKGYRQGSILDAYWVLHSVVQAQIPKHIDRLPWGRWRPAPKLTGREVGAERPAPATLEQREALLWAARQHDEPRWSRGLYGGSAYTIGVAMAAGLRQAELCGLCWCDLELDGPVPMLRLCRQAPKGWQKVDPTEPPQLPPKERRTTVLQLATDAAELLRQQRAQLQRLGWWRPDGPVFPRGKGNQPAGWRTSGIAIDPETLRAIWRTAGLDHAERAVPHCLRHIFATAEGTSAMLSTGDLRAAMARTRHTDQRTFMGYLHRVGVGLPAPAAAPMRTGLMAPAILALTGEAPTEPADARPMAEPPRWAEVRAAELQRDRELAEARELPWAELARRWAERPDRALSGAALPRPRAITERARKAATKARNAAITKTRKAGHPEPECIAAAKAAYARSHRQVLARWTQELAAATRGAGDLRSTPDAESSSAGL